MNLSIFIWGFFLILLCRQRIDNFQSPTSSFASPVASAEIDKPEIKTTEFVNNSNFFFSFSIISKQRVDFVKCRTI